MCNNTYIPELFRYVTTSLVCYYFPCRNALRSVQIISNYPLEFI